MRMPSVKNSAAFQRGKKDSKTIYAQSKRTHVGMSGKDEDRSMKRIKQN